MPAPKLLTQKFLPGLAEQHEVGLGGVGVHVIETTLNANPASIPTDAGIIAAIPNTGAASMSYGPVVHSLGTPPTFAEAQLRIGTPASAHMVTVAYITADNSAVYLRAQSYTGGPNAVAVRVVIIR